MAQIVQNTTLIIGACGQIGTELTLALRKAKGAAKIIASDIQEGSAQLMQSGPFEMLDATDYSAVEDTVLHQDVSEIYLMAAMLSATAEKFPQKAWNLNMKSLLHVLDLAKEGKVEKIFWPSSIAVFGPDSPKKNTPQQAIMEPSTVYGISKLAGERWCSYYHQKYGVDVRSIRYPGLLSWKTAPGGGTTDYAIEMYHKAVANGKYTCFLNKDTRLPMMYMDDAIRATLQLMSAPADNIESQSSYNLAAINFTPEELAQSIRNHIPEFKVDYEPDFRQQIADSWPSSLDDQAARKDWGWAPEFDLERTTEEMLSNIS
ncbi:MAG: NAD-dependent epimerase/dehydratase family protein [Eudoraea sp.]|nr:NAD-dependent epimerase/dehydratase family protein [Eudoraea sp.]